MNASEIAERTKRVLAEVPSHVTVVAAVKTRTPEEAAAAVEGGIRHLGHNYVQEAAAMKEHFPIDPASVQWHMIGHLQRNKAKKALKVFDVIQTVDSHPLLDVLERECAKAERTIPVFIEVNIAEEQTKSGILPEDVPSLAERTAKAPHLRLEGLMTMGPPVNDPEELRPFFRKAAEIFERLRERHPSVKWLSMGMSDSYRVAIEEGANMIRLGTTLFGRRR